MVTADEELAMDEPILGDLDEVALPELPDSVWMRLLANALDPDAAQTSLDLIPADDPVAGLTDDGVPADSAGDETVIDPAADAGPDDHDGGSDLLPHHDPALDADGLGHGHETSWEHGDPGASPWSGHSADHSDDHHGGF